MPSQPPNTQLQWLTIDDFSPGIQQRTSPGLLTGTTLSPPGTAQATNTYRCIALPHGGLGPLPKRHYTYSFPTLGDASKRTVEGFHIFGPLKRYAGLTTSVFPSMDQENVNIHPVEFYLAYGVEFVAAGVQHHHDNIDAIPVYADPHTTETLQLVHVDTLQNVGRFPPVYFCTFRANDLAPTVIGDPKIGFSRGVLDEPAATNTRVQFYPDLTVGTPFVSDMDNFGGIIEAHQSRVINLRREEFAWHDAVAGVTAQNNWSTESIVFTDLNTTLNMATNFLDIAGETHYGFGCVASIDASDLLLIRHKGGAYLIQGDISYPTVRRLPGVTSTYGTECRGVSTSLGFVYGVNNGGVHLWQGGQNSMPLSPMLDDSFWITPEASLLQNYRGDFAQWKSLILTPNNWAFDVSTKSWWRLEDPDAMQFLSYKVNPVNNVLYGVKCSFDNLTLNVIEGFSPVEGTGSYSWQSQPLSPTIQRIVNVRECQVVVQGEGQVTITLTGSDPDKTFVFDIPTGYATKPRLMRKMASWLGTHLQVRIEATNPSGPAPIVHAWRGGCIERMQEALA